MRWRAAARSCFSRLEGAYGSSNGRDSHVDSELNYFLRAENSSADEYKLSHNVDSLEQAWTSRSGQHHEVTVSPFAVPAFVP